MAVAFQLGLGLVGLYWGGGAYVRYRLRDNVSWC